MRRAARRDANEELIVDALEHTGWLVHRLSAKGVPDLLCHSWRLNKTLLVEVKGKRGRLTPDQQAFVGKWPVVIVRTPEEAIELGRFSSGVGTGGANR